MGLLPNSFSLTLEASTQIPVVVSGCIFSVDETIVFDDDTPVNTVLDDSVVAFTLTVTTGVDGMLVMVETFVDEDDI